jgi:hypothetical protein
VRALTSARPTLDPLAKQLGEIETLIDDVADQLRSYADRLEGDPERLAHLDERLALIRRLTRKHGGSLDEVIGAGSRLTRLYGGVTQIYVTDGAPRDMRDARGAGFYTREAYAAARRRELAGALALAGISMDQTIHIGVMTDHS